MKARDNPFAVSRVLRIRYRLDEAGWAQLLTRWCSSGYRGAIVGPQGSGKTTLLEDLRPRLVGCGFRVKCRWLDNQSGPLSSLFEGLGARDCVMVDGAEQMGWGAWSGCRSRMSGLGGVIVTAHRPGLFPTVWECRTSPDLLAGILSDLLGQPVAQTAGLADPLYRRHQGNLREALREMYDRYALV